MDENEGWIPLGATDLGSSRSVDYDPETGTITVNDWSRTRTADGGTVELTRVEEDLRIYPAGTPVEDVLRDLME
jgi:hypothetical protein